MLSPLEIHLTSVYATLSSNTPTSIVSQEEFKSLRTLAKGWRRSTTSHQLKVVCALAASTTTPIAMRAWTVMGAARERREPVELVK